MTAAALESGYGSTSAFIAMFRKQLGAAPTRYLDTDFGRRIQDRGRTPLISVESMRERGNAVIPEVCEPPS